MKIIKEIKICRNRYDIFSYKNFLVDPRLTPYFINKACSTIFDKVYFNHLSSDVLFNTVADR